MKSCIWQVLAAPQLRTSNAPSAALDGAGIGYDPARSGAERPARSHSRLGVGLGSAIFRPGPCGPHPACSKNASPSQRASSRNDWRAGKDSNPRPSGSKNVEGARSDASLRLVACEALKGAAIDCTGDGPTALYGPSDPAPSQPAALGPAPPTGVRGNLPTPPLGPKAETRQYSHARRGVRPAPDPPGRRCRARQGRADFPQSFARRA
jgi:hypothetical protein